MKYNYSLDKSTQNSECYHAFMELSSDCTYFTITNRIRIEKTKPNYLIIFAWIHADKIIKNNQKFLNNGGSFIRFYPKIELIKKIN